MKTIVTLDVKHSAQTFATISQEFDLPEAVTTDMLPATFMISSEGVEARIALRNHYYHVEKGVCLSDTPTSISITERVAVETLPEFKNQAEALGWAVELNESWMPPAELKRRAEEQRKAAKEMEAQKLVENKAHATFTEMLVYICIILAMSIAWNHFLRLPGGTSVAMVEFLEYDLSRPLWIDVFGMWITTTSITLMGVGFRVLWYRRKLRQEAQSPENGENNAVA